MDIATYVGRTLTPIKQVAYPNPTTVGFCWDNSLDGIKPLKETTPLDPKVVFVGPASHHSTLPTIQFIPNPTLYPSQRSFRSDVMSLRSQGKKVLLTVYGDFSLVFDPRTEKEFVDGCKELVDQYGFSGINLQLSSLDTSQFLGSALQGLSPLDLTLTVQGDKILTGAFLDLIKSHKNYLTLLVPQFWGYPTTPDGIVKTLSDLAKITPSNNIMMGLTPSLATPGYLPLKDFHNVWNALVRGDNTTYIFPLLWDLRGVIVPVVGDYYNEITQHILGRPYGSDSGQVI